MLIFTDIRFAQSTVVPFMMQFLWYFQLVNIGVHDIWSSCFVEERMVPIFMFVACKNKYDTSLLLTESDGPDEIFHKISGLSYAKFINLINMTTWVLCVLFISNFNPCLFYTILIQVTFSYSFASYVDDYKFRNMHAENGLTKKVKNCLGIDLLIRRRKKVAYHANSSIFLGLNYQYMWKHIWHIPIISILECWPTNCVLPYLTSMHLLCLVMHS